jgi:hypothetical protein
VGGGEERSLSSWIASHGGLRLAGVTPTALVLSLEPHSLLRVPAAPFVGPRVPCAGVSKGGGLLPFAVPGPCDVPGSAAFGGVAGSPVSPARAHTEDPLKVCAGPGRPFGLAEQCVPLAPKGGCWGFACSFSRFARGGVKRFRRFRLMGFSCAPGLWVGALSFLAEVFGLAAVLSLGLCAWDMATWQGRPVTGAGPSSVCAALCAAPGQTLGDSCRLSARSPVVFSRYGIRALAGVRRNNQVLLISFCRRCLGVPSGSPLDPRAPLYFKAGWGSVENPRGATHRILARMPLPT